MSLIEFKNNQQAAEAVFDIINRAFQFESKEFRTIIANNEIWFCGKDVAEILEYSKTRKAIEDHVRDKNKKTLDELLKNIKGPDSFRFKGNEKASIYINEPSLFSLIMKMIINHS